jgi:transposase-like protein
MRNQRKYDKEFRMNAVKHYESRGKSIDAVSKDLGIPSSTLYGWVQEYKEHGEQSFPGSGHIKPCNEEYYRLKKELDDVKMERDILKKAVAIFSRAKK